MGTTATSSQVHEASVCVSFCFCRCSCMPPCMWFKLYTFSFLPCRLLSASCVVSFPPRVHVCVRVCRTDRRPHNWLVSAYHTQQQKLSGFPTTEFSLQKCFPISVIHRWCPRTQQASTFPINSETTHSFHQRLHD